VTRPAYHVDVATAAAVNIAQPSGSVQVSGFPANSKFSSANANWLFRRLGEWSRELDAAGLRISHLLDSTEVMLVEGNGVSVPTGAGLGPLTPDDGGIYLLGGRLVDLSAAAIASKYAAAWTFAAGSVTYIHAKVEDSSAGSAYGAVYLSLNVSEPGYTAIAAVTTDATDVTSVASLATSRRVISPDLTLVGEASLQGSTEIIGSGLTVSAPTTFSNTFSGSISSASTLLGLSQAGAGYALDALGSGSGTTARLRATGSGSALEIEGSTGATAVSISGGAGQGALLVSGGSGASAITVNPSGAAAGLTVNGAGFGVAAIVASGGSGNTPALSATGAGTAAAVVATSSSTASSVGLSATAGSTTSRAISATGSATGGATGSRAIYADGQQGAGIEARSSAYYAALVQGDTSSPAYPALRVVGQDADPSDTLFGGLVAQSTMSQWRFPVPGYGYRSIMSMGRAGGGSALYACNNATGTEYTENAGTWTTTLTASALAANGNGYYGLSVGAKVLIRVTCEARSLSAAAANIVNMRLIDSALGTGSPIATRSGAGPSATSGFELLSLTTTYQRSISWVVEYTPSANGDLSIYLQIQRGTANGIRIRDLSIEILGTF